MSTKYVKSSKPVFDPLDPFTQPGALIVYGDHASSRELTAMYHRRQHHARTPMPPIIVALVCLLLAITIIGYMRHRAKRDCDMKVVEGHELCFSKPHYSKEYRDD